VCSAKTIVAYHDATKLSSMTVLETLHLTKWNSVLLTYEVVVYVPQIDIYIIIMHI
jgi:hypothetical protein